MEQNGWDEIEDTIQWEMPKEYIDYFAKPSGLLESTNEQSSDENNKQESIEEDER